MTVNVSIMMYEVCYYHTMIMDGAISDHQENGNSVYCCIATTTWNKDANNMISQIKGSLAVQI